jgi:hypothetical protein
MTQPTGDYGEDRLREMFADLPIPAGVRQWQPPPQPEVRHDRLASTLTAVATLTITAVIVLAVQAWPADTPRPVDPVATGTAAPPASEPVSPPPSAATPGTGAARPAPTGSATRQPAPPSWPGTATTGVPAGTRLTEHHGDLHVRVDGAVIADVHVRGSVYVEAANVTLRRVRIDPVEPAERALYQLLGAANLVVEDCELNTARTHPVQFAFHQQARGLVMRRCHVSGARVGLLLAQGAEVSDNLIDNMLPEPNTAGVLTVGNLAGPVVIRHNTVLIDQGSAAIGLYTTYGPTRTTTVDGNLLAGGTWSLHAGGDLDGTRDVRIVGNHFSRAKWPGSGARGPATAWGATRPGALWQDNVWHETGAPIPPP